MSRDRQLTEFTDGNLGTKIMTYDASGALLSSTDGAERVVHRTFDDIGRFEV